jgi:hypothetical protein
LAARPALGQDLGLLELGYELGERRRCYRHTTAEPTRSNSIGAHASVPAAGPPLLALCSNAHSSVDSHSSSGAQSTTTWCYLLNSWLRSRLERTTRAGILRAHNPVVVPGGDQDEIHLSESPDRFRTEGELAG